MPELTDNQIADLRALQNNCAELGAEIVVIGAIAYQVHFPAESRQTGDIDFAVALDLDEFAELERRLVADGWVRFAHREHRWRSVQGTILDLIPAGPKLREAKQVTWPASQFTMSLVGFDHVFASAQPTQLAPALTLKVISSTTLTGVLCQFPPRGLGLHRCGIVCCDSKRFRFTPSDHQHATCSL